jgi:deoxyribose-phosphate aldolase
LKKEEVYGHIDHTLLKAFSTTEQIEAIAEEALKYGTASICIPASFVNYIHNKYKDVNICTVIGFPLGYSTTSIKVAEAKQAIEDGANEIDMVINIGWAKEHMTFVLAGIFIGITAILQISYANSITTVSSLRSISMIFQPLMGVLIAFAIQQWCNLTLGVFISQFTLSMMFNALIALGVPSKMQDVVLGVMLIIVMGIALNNKRISGFFERKARRKELMKRA